MTFYIFRHGVTFYSKTNTPYPADQNSADILQEGIPATEKIGKYLKNIKTDGNFCSEIYRCRQTSEIVSKISGKKFVFDHNLNEYIENQFDEFNVQIKEFLKFLKRNNLKSIAICTHGAVIAGLKHLITEGEFKSEQIFDFPNPGIITKIENLEVEEIDFN